MLILGLTVKFLVRLVCCYSPFGAPVMFFLLIYGALILT